MGNVIVLAPTYRRVPSWSCMTELCPAKPREASALEPSPGVPAAVMPVARVTASWAVVSPRSRISEPGRVSTEAGSSWRVSPSRLPTSDGCPNSSEPAALRSAGAVTVTSGNVVWLNEKLAVSAVTAIGITPRAIDQSLCMRRILSAWNIKRCHHMVRSTRLCSETKVRWRDGLRRRAALRSGGAARDSRVDLTDALPTWRRLVGIHAP